MNGAGASSGTRAVQSQSRPSRTQESGLEENVFRLSIEGGGSHRKGHERTQETPASPACLHLGSSEEKA